MYRFSSLCKDFWRDPPFVKAEISYSTQSLFVLIHLLRMTAFFLILSQCKIVPPSKWSWPMPYGTCRAAIRHGAVSSCLVGSNPGEFVVHPQLKVTHFRSRCGFKIFFTKGHCSITLNKRKTPGCKNTSLACQVSPSKIVVSDVQPKKMSQR